jgi:large subunit ribosomal protein L1
MRGKNHLKALSGIEKSKRYTVKEGVSLLKESSYAKYDESVEVHFNLNIDPRHADQQLRGAITLPKGIGKEKRVAVVVKNDEVDLYKSSEADHVGGSDIIEKIQSGWIDFDVLISSPGMMSQVGKLGRILGAKGLMPNPKLGTVTQEIESAVKAFKAGKSEYRNDKYGILHFVIGKVSFDLEDLVKNFEMVYHTVLKIKPAKAKGTYVKSVSLSSSNGVGLFLDPLNLSS